MKARYESLCQHFTKEGLDCVIISKLEKIRYFSGFTGSAGILLVTSEKKLLLTDFRYIE